MKAPTPRPTEPARRQPRPHRRADARVLAVCYDSEPDHLGRRRFSLHWRTDYIPGHPACLGDRPSSVPLVRGQHFFAVPDLHLARLRADGWEIIETKNGEQREALLARRNPTRGKP